jgi:hypothetical protein
MSTPWLTLALFIVALLVGGAATPVIFQGHDFTWWRLLLWLIAVAVGGTILTLIYQGIEKAISE